MSTHDSGALVQGHGSWGEGYHDSRRNPYVLGQAGTLGDDHMGADSGHRPKHRPLASPRQPGGNHIAKRQDQGYTRPPLKPFLSMPKLLGVLGQPNPIYPLRNSASPPTLRPSQAKENLRQESQRQEHQLADITASDASSFYKMRTSSLLQAPAQAAAAPNDYMHDKQRAHHDEDAAKDIQRQENQRQRERHIATVEKMAHEMELIKQLITPFLKIAPAHAAAVPQDAAPFEKSPAGAPRQTSEESRQAYANAIDSAFATLEQHEAKSNGSPRTTPSQAPAAEKLAIATTPREPPKSARLDDLADLTPDEPLARPSANPPPLTEWTLEMSHFTEYYPQAMASAMERIALFGSTMPAAAGDLKGGLPPEKISSPTFDTSSLEACAGDINIYYSPMSPVIEDDRISQPDSYYDDDADSYAGYGPPNPGPDEEDADSYVGYGPPNPDFDGEDADEPG